MLQYEIKLFEEVARTLNWTFAQLNWTWWVRPA